MKTLLKVFLLIPLLLISSCRSDDAETDQVSELESKTYILSPVESSGISGSVRFIKNSNFTLSIELNMLGTSNNDFHSAFLYYDNAANDGEDIALTLDIVVGETGMSTTVFTKLDDDTSITYEELLNFDGYIEVKSNDTNLNLPVANTDIGQNELTSTQITYDLEELDLTDASGTITFKKRKNGEALAEIDLIGTPQGGMHPAHIHANDAATGGPILFTFKAVNGTTGTSETNVEKLDDDTPFVYDDVLTVNGYINVHLSASNLAVIIAQGNIGIN